jgi:hypothetical protein
MSRSEETGTLCATSPHSRINSVRAETAKLARSTYFYVFIVITSAGSGVLAWLAAQTDLSPPYHIASRRIVALQLDSRASLCEVLASLFDIWFSTKETKDDTWRVSLLFASNRRRLAAAKLIVVSIGACFLGLVAVASDLMASSIAVSIGNQSATGALTVGACVGAALHQGLLIIFVAILLSLVWFTIALYIMQPVAAVAGYVVYFLLVANGLVLLAPGVARWLPEGASQSIAIPIPMIAIGSGASNVSPLGQTFALFYLGVLAFAFATSALLGGLNRDFD